MIYSEIPLLRRHIIPLLSLNEFPSFLGIITSLPSLVVTALMQRIRASRSIISVIHWRLLPVILLGWIILWRPIVPSIPLRKTLLIVRHIPLLVRSGISLSIISWLVRVSILLTEPTTLVSTIMDRRWPWCYNTILILVSWQSQQHIKTKIQYYLIVVTSK